MGYYSTETVTIETENGTELELEIEASWGYAEPDVGIMGDYLDEWEVIAVNGSTRHAEWVDKIVSRSDKWQKFIDNKIYDNQ